MPRYNPARTKGEKKSKIREGGIKEKRKKKKRGTGGEKQDWNQPMCQVPSVVPVHVNSSLVG